MFHTILPVGDIDLVIYPVWVVGSKKVPYRAVAKLSIKLGTDSWEVIGYGTSGAQIPYPVPFSYPESHPQLIGQKNYLL
jgi:hypothetical protein